MNKFTVLIIIIVFDIFLGVITITNKIIKGLRKELKRATTTTKLEITCKNIRQACYNVKCKNRQGFKK